MRVRVPDRSSLNDAVQTGEIHIPVGVRCHTLRRTDRHVQGCNRRRRWRAAGVCRNHKLLGLGWARAAALPASAKIMTR